MDAEFELGCASDFSPVVVLRREKQLHGTLADRVAEEVVQGTVSPSRYLSLEYANKLGLPISQTGPEYYQIVDIDEKYFDKTLSQILWATLWLSASGFGLLMYVLSRLHAKQFKDKIRHDQVRAQVALSSSISRQEVSRY